MTERDKLIAQAEALEDLLDKRELWSPFGLLGLAQFLNKRIGELRALAAQQPEAVEPVAWMAAHDHKQLTAYKPLEDWWIPLYAHASDFKDAYVGAREDLEAWKRRALAAEKNNRQLTRALQEQVNSPTFMGEPANGSNGDTSRMVIDGNSRTYIGGGGAGAPADHTAADATVREEGSGLKTAASAVGVTPDLDALVAGLEHRGEDGAADAITDLRAEVERAKTQRAGAWKAFTRLRRAYSMVRYPTLTEELRLLYDAAGKGEEKS